MIPGQTIPAVIDALIFDVDGTLAETEEAHRLSFNQAFTEAGLDWIWTRDDYRDLLKVTGGKERIAHYITTSPSLPSLPRSGEGQTSLSDVRVGHGEATRISQASPSPTLTASPSVPPHEGREEDPAAFIRALHARKTEIYAAQVATGAVALRPGIEALIRQALSRGVALAIATTTSRPNIDALLTATLGPEASAWFSAMACGDMVRAKKPAPEVYDLALSQLGVPAARAVAIEDSWNGVRAARAAGLAVIATPSLYSAGDDFSEATVITEPKGIAAALGWAP